MRAGGWNGSSGLIARRGGVLELTARIDTQPGRQVMRTDLTQMAERVPPVMSLRHRDKRRDRPVRGVRIDRELDGIADRTGQCAPGMERHAVAP